MVKGSGSDKALYFKNQLNDPSTAGEVVSSTSFSYKGITINLVDQKINSTEGYLVARNASTGAIINSFGNLGSVDYSIGSVAINGNVLSAGTDITVTAKPKYTDLITIKNEFLVNVSATVTGA